jgi:DNA-binding Lrp family transcriptional regulator
MMAQRLYLSGVIFHWLNTGSLVTWTARPMPEYCGIGCFQGRGNLLESRAMSTDPLLELLRSKARHTHEELAELLALSEAEVRAKIAAWEKDGTILGYHAVVNGERAGDQDVQAFIEVKVTPERGGGFDRLAMRIARFDQVVSCYLASGGYDLMVVVEGSDLREVARFVSERLSTLDGVLSTATHFLLKTYKQNGFLFEGEGTVDRLVVSP